MGRHALGRRWRAGDGSWRWWWRLNPPQLPGSRRNRGRGQRDRERDGGVRASEQIEERRARGNESTRAASTAAPARTAAADPWSQYGTVRTMPHPTSLAEVEGVMLPLSTMWSHVPLRQALGPLCAASSQERWLAAPLVRHRLNFSSVVSTTNEEEEQDQHQRPQQRPQQQELTKKYCSEDNVARKPPHPPAPSSSSSSSSSSSFGSSISAGKNPSSSPPSSCASSPSPSSSPFPIPSLSNPALGVITAQASAPAPKRRGRDAMVEGFIAAVTRDDAMPEHITQTEVRRALAVFQRKRAPALAEKAISLAIASGVELDSGPFCRAIDICAQSFHLGAVQRLMRAMQDLGLSWRPFLQCALYRCYMAKGQDEDAAAVLSLLAEHKELTPRLLASCLRAHVELGDCAATLAQHVTEWRSLYPRTVGTSDFVRAALENVATHGPLDAFTEFAAWVTSEQTAEGLHALVDTETVLRVSIRAHARHGHVAEALTAVQELERAGVQLDISDMHAVTKAFVAADSVEEIIPRVGAMLAAHGMCLDGAFCVATLETILAQPDLHRRDDAGVRFFASALHHTPHDGGGGAEIVYRVEGTAATVATPVAASSVAISTAPAGLPAETLSPGSHPRLQAVPEKTPTPSATTAASAASTSAAVAIIATTYSPPSPSTPTPATPTQESVSSLSEEPPIPPPACAVGDLEKAGVLLLRHLASQRKWPALNVLLNMCEHHGVCLQSGPRVVLSNTRWTGATQIADRCLAMLERQGLALATHYKAALHVACQAGRVARALELEQQLEAQGQLSVTDRLRLLDCFGQAGEAEHALRVVRLVRHAKYKDPHHRVAHSLLRAVLRGRGLDAAVHLLHSFQEEMGRKPPPALSIVLARELATKQRTHDARALVDTLVHDGQLSSAAAQQKHLHHQLVAAVARRNPWAALEHLHTLGADATQGQVVFAMSACLPQRDGHSVSHRRKAHQHTRSRTQVQAGQDETLGQQKKKAEGKQEPEQQEQTYHHQQHQQHQQHHLAPVDEKGALEALDAMHTCAVRHGVVLSTRTRRTIARLREQIMQGTTLGCESGPNQGSA